MLFVFWVLCLQVVNSRRRENVGVLFLLIRIWTYKLICVGFCFSWKPMGVWLQLVHCIKEGWGVVKIWRMVVLQLGVFCWFFATFDFSGDQSWLRFSYPFGVFVMETWWQYNSLKTKRPCSLTFVGFAKEWNFATKKIHCFVAHFILVLTWISFKDEGKTRD
jgi:hypothetical protein